MFRYQKTQRYFGQISEDCKEIGFQEIIDLGGTDAEMVYRGVYFNADYATLYKIVYCNRLFSRILAPLHMFDCHHDDHIHKQAKRMEWDQFLNLDKTFAIYANVGNSNVRHSKFASLRLKDAICDYFRDKYGERPNVDTENPDVCLNLFVFKNKATINIDLTGGAAYKRGYRNATVKAPMRETLAAAAMTFSGWDGETPLYDPMCGSGTILIEAIMKYCRMPAMYFKKRLGFENLPDFDEKLWENVRSECDANIRELPENLIFGSDQDSEAIQAFTENLESFNLADKINIRKCSFQDAGLLENVTIITNAPYGVRLNSEEDMHEFMGEIGDFLKQQCTGSTAWLYVGSTALVKKIGLRVSKRIPLENGGLDGRLVRLDMYKGTLNP